MEPSTAPLTLVRATHADLPAVQALAHTVWRAHYPGIISHAQIDYMLARSYTLPALARFVDDPRAGLELVRAGAEVVGFAAWYCTDDPADVKLDRLYVLPSWQRGGVGGRLIARVATLSRTHGASRLILNVNKDNVQAQNAYRRHGFEVCEAVVVDIGNGYVMDDYVMEKAL